MKKEIKEWKDKYKQMDQKMRSQRNMSEDTRKEVIDSHYHM